LHIKAKATDTDVLLCGTVCTLQHNCHTTSGNLNYTWC